MEKTIENKQKKKPKATKKPEKDFNLKTFRTEVNKTLTDKLLLKNVDILKGIITYTDVLGKVHTVTTEEKVLFFNSEVSSNKVFNFGYPVIHYDVIRKEYHDEYYDEDDDDYYTEDEPTVYYEFLINIHFLIEGQNYNYSCFGDNAFKKTTAFKNEYRSQGEAVQLRNAHKFYTSYNMSNYDEEATSFLFIKGKLYKEDEIKELKEAKFSSYSLIHVGFKWEDQGRKFMLSRNTESNLDKIEEFLETKTLKEPLSDLNFDLHSNITSSNYVHILEKTKGLKGIKKIDNFIYEEIRKTHKVLRVSNYIIDYDKELVKSTFILDFPEEKQHYDCCGAYMSYGHGNMVKKFEFDKVLTDTNSALIYFYSLNKSKAHRWLYLIDYQKEDSLRFYNKVFGNIKLMDSYKNINSGATIYVYKVHGYERVSNYTPIEQSIEHNRWSFLSSINNFRLSGKELMLYQWIKNSEDAKIKKTKKRKQKKTIREQRATTFNHRIGEGMMKQIRNAPPTQFRRFNRKVNF